MELIDQFVDPKLKEEDPETYGIQVAAVENTLEYQSARAQQAAVEFGRALGDWLNTALQIIKDAITPIINVVKEYEARQQDQGYIIEAGRQIGMNRQAHLAANARKYRTRKKNLRRIEKGLKKALREGEKHE